MCLRHVSWYEEHVISIPRCMHDIHSLQIIRQTSRRKSRTCHFWNIENVMKYMYYVTFTSVICKTEWQDARQTTTSIHFRHYYLLLECKFKENDWDFSNKFFKCKIMYVKKCRQKVSGGLTPYVLKIILKCTLNINDS